MKATPEQDYEGTANALVLRMLESLLAHPEAANGDVWGMLKVPGFRCDDLQPSMFQAGWAFAKAKKMLADEHKGGGGQ